MNNKYQSVIPKGWPGIKKNLRYDVLSGFIVSLIALPLCLGVASASNFPPITGVLTAIIGGLIIGFISGSELAIKGPAAGLIVIVSGAVEEYGRGNIQQGYLLTCSLIAVTGLMQIILGALKIGKWADFIPSSIIHGMLAAIGVIIISKQIHLLIGITPAEIKGMEPVELIKHIPKSLVHLEWHISLIGILSLSLLFLLPRIKNPFVKTIPPFLIVIVVSIIIAQTFHLTGEKYKFYNALINPGKLQFNFAFATGIFSPENLVITTKYFCLLTIIGTIESMLTVKAVDLLDPYKRSSSYNKDVIAIGAGNLIAGLLGGLPMISEVARSSANINNKAVTRVSNIAHGAFLVLFVFLFVSLIKLIPVAALSSILIFVGLKLANPKDFLKAYKVSHEHFVVFLGTAIVTVCIDMLVGVLTGVALKILINFVRSGELKKLFKPKLIVERTERQCILYLDSAAVFTNWLSVKKILENEKGKRIVVDFSETKIVDASFVENISRFKENYADEFVMRSFQEMHPVKSHPYSMRIKSNDSGVVTIQLNRHQRELKAFCEERNFIVSFSTVIPPNYFSSFKSFKHTDLKQTRVFVTGSIHGIKFEYVEGLMYDSVDMLEYHANVLGIEFGSAPVPRFMMQRESKLDTVIEFLIKNQVVFENNPKFNSMYSIYSRDKEGVKTIFNEAVIDYFEKHDTRDRIIEGNGENKIIVYNNGTDPGTMNLQFLLAIGSIIRSGKVIPEQLVETY
jgi:MFS superfamily sulfate permease-like transporter